MKNYALITISAILVLLMSGFSYYFLAPQNWGAGELILNFHLWFGLIFFFYIAYTIRLHIKEKKDIKCDKKFTIFAYLLLFAFTSVTISGLVHFVPYLSYFFKPIYYRFETYDFISTLHLISATVLLILLASHLSIKIKGRKLENSKI